MGTHWAWLQYALHQVTKVWLHALPLHVLPANDSIAMKPCSQGQVKALTVERLSNLLMRQTLESAGLWHSRLRMNAADEAG